MRSKCVWPPLSFGLIFLMFRACRIFQNWGWKYFSTFFSDFCTLFIIKGPNFLHFYFKSVNKMLIECFKHTFYLFWIKKISIFILFFWIFLQILKDISNPSKFRPICVYIFFAIFTKDMDFWIMGAFWYYF